MTTIANLVVRIGADITDLQRGMANAEVSSKGLLIAVTAASAAVAVLGFKSVIAAGEMEQTSVAFETMLQSAEKADKLMSGLKKFATTTPFEFTEITTAAKSLLAFGVAGEDMVDTMTRLGDVASGIGMPFNDLAQIYGKIKTQGQFYGDDLRQLGGRGIPMIRMLAEQFGVAEGSIKKMVETGQVGFANIEQAFIDMTKEGSQFGGMMDKQSKTLLGMWSNLQDAIGQTMIALGDKLIESMQLKESLDLVIEWGNNIQTALEEGSIADAFDAAFSEKMQIAIFAISGAITFALLPALKSLAVHMWAVLSPLLPLMAVGAVFGVLGYAVYKASEAMKGTSTEAEKIATTTGNAAVGVEDLSKATSGLNKSLGLLSFDEINQLGSSTGSLIDGASTAKDIEKIQKAISDIDVEVTPVISWLNKNIFGNDFTRGWEEIGENGFKAWWNGFISLMNPKAMLEILFDTNHERSYRQGGEDGTTWWGAFLTIVDGSALSNLIFPHPEDKGKTKATDWFRGFLSMIDATALRDLMFPSKIFTDAGKQAVKDFIDAFKASIPNLTAILEKSLPKLSEPSGTPYAPKYQWPGFATGSNFIMQDQLAYVHKGEEIVPADTNKHNNDRMDAILSGLESMISNGSQTAGGSFNLYLDGREITSEVRRRESVDNMRTGGR